MKPPDVKGGKTQVSRLIKQPSHKVYQAFLDPDAIATWLAPGNMQMHVHAFDPQEEGSFCISLTYQDPEDGQLGKLADLVEE